MLLLKYITFHKLISLLKSLNLYPPILLFFNKKFSLLFILLALLLSLFLLAPILSPYPPNQPLVGDPLAIPSRQHWLGCDEFGRDIFSRLLYGGRVSLFIALFVESMILIIALTTALIATLLGGVADKILILFLITIHALPYLLVAMIIILLLGGGLYPMLLVMISLGWTHHARIFRLELKSLWQKEYIVASQLFGAKKRYLIFYQAIPALFPTIILLGTLGIPQIMLLEASLSYLGLGIKIPTASWGGMIYSGQHYLRIHPVYAASAAISLGFIVLLFTMLGDRLLEYLSRTS